jgi:RNA-directed DNA polymerase
MARYADDFVILCRTVQEAQRALALVTEWMQGAELKLHPQKTKIVDATQRDGFEFLGYHFERGQKWPRKKSEVKVREKLRARTRQTNGQSLKSIIAGINPILQGWFNYFQYSKLNALQAMDGWIRGRLRSILRKRTKSTCLCSTSNLQIRSIFSSGNKSPCASSTPDPGSDCEHAETGVVMSELRH